MWRWDLMANDQANPVCGPAETDVEQQETIAVTNDAEQLDGSKLAVERFVSQPFFSRDGVEVHNRDCRELLGEIADSSIDLIVTDPPYFKVKGDDWDWQWDKPADFLAWMGTLCDEWQRVLKPNGSLYVFASPRMAWGVEGEVRKRFNVCNSITWRKDGRSRQQCKEEQRMWWPDSERIIFAEHFGADNIAKGEAGYGAKCDELRGFVFEPIMRYIVSEFENAQLSRREVDTHFKTANVSQYWLQPRGFIIPTADKWDGLRTIRPEHFRREYEDLRRPFNVTADVPYTDVWDFPTVGAYEGKHPCEKPLAMMEHIVAASSKPGALVLDCFAGSGVVGEAARNCGRRAILCEIDAGWCENIKNMLRQGRLFAAAG
jgi:site-specific DNA-methyltransferase (adenine-specific)